MATIDEIFDTMPEGTYVPYEELEIDAERRVIFIPESESVFGVESDTQAERKHFRCPRYVGDGLDLAACLIRINFRNANGEVDSYLVDDVTIDGADVTFSWELWKKVTAYKGKVQFIVCAIMGEGLPEWNTTLAAGNVLEGLEPDSSHVEAETADVIAQLIAMVKAQTDAVEAVGIAQCNAVREVGENTVAEAKAAVEAKGAAVVASIPAEYTALSNTVDKLTRDRASAIVCEAEGETIQVNDASADPIIGLHLFGKSTQDGTPTPEAPIEIVSAKAPVVTVCGRNLMRWPVHEPNITRNGVTFTANNDGSVSVIGVSGDTGTWWVANYQEYLPAGVYTLSGIFEGFADSSQIYAYVTDRATSTTLVIIRPTKAAVSFSIPVDLPMAGISMAIPQAETLYGKVWLQLEAGNVATEYKQPSITGRLNLSTPTALPGIPVTSGGNYTDANGQQWVADEVDLSRGVYVQRVGRLMLDGSAKWNAYNYESTYYGFHIWDLLDEYHYRSVGMCNQFEIVGGSSGDCIWVGASNANVYAISKEWYDKGLDAWKAHLNAKPLDIIYARATPIETPLTIEEIEAFKALLANKPTTTVLNDAGAWMKLEYVADTKLYIDNKIAAILAAK